MFTYHFCAMAQIQIGQTSYFDGVFSSEKQILATNNGYDELRDSIRDMFQNIGNAKISILSLSLIGSD